MQAPIQWRTGLWHQVALTYSPSNVNFYLDGRLAPLDNVTYVPSYVNSQGALLHTNLGGGMVFYPPEDARLLGLCLGQLNNNGGIAGYPAKGNFDELETFNYPLSAAEIARDFPNARGVLVDPMLDSDYDGRSDLLETYVDGTDPNSASSVAANRLGYWRFNSESNNLVGEQGQPPLVTSNVAVAAGWSSNAVSIPASGARLVYRDVETNGWANINCRKGSVSLWLKPNWSGVVGPDRGEMVYVGDSSGSNQWSLHVSCNGSHDVGFVVASNGPPVTLLNASYAFTAEKWHHVVLTYTPTTSELFINGNSVGTGGGTTNYLSEVVLPDKRHRLWQYLTGCHADRRPDRRVGNLQLPLVNERNQKEVRSCELLGCQF